MPFFKMPDIFYTDPAEPTHRVKYGKKPMQHITVRIPDGPGPHPTLLTIHGGQWKSAYRAKQLEYLCEDLKAHGLATANLEFKRVGHVDGGYPGTFFDLLDGIEFVREHAGEWNLDLNMSILGHSSGGHLAFCLAGHDDFEGRKLNFRPKSLIGIAGVYNLGTASSKLQEITDEFFGTHEKLSPINMIPMSCPQTLIVGEKDKLTEQALGYVEAVQNGGYSDITLEIIDDCSHFRVIDPTFPGWPSIKQAILKAVI